MEVTTGLVVAVVVLLPCHRRTVVPVAGKVSVQLELSAQVYLDKATTGPYDSPAFKAAVLVVGLAVMVR